jgi:GWxTD domain-containing protein
MGHRRSAKQLIVAGLLLVATVAGAQRFSTRDARTYYDYGQRLYTAAYQSCDGENVTVTLNTSNTIFSFLKTSRRNTRGAYYAVRDITIELRQAPAGKIIDSKNFRDTIYAKNFEMTTTKEAWHSTVVTLNVEGAAQKAEVHVEVRDGFLSRLAAAPRTIPVAIRPYHAERSATGRDSTFIGISDPYLVDSAVSADRYFSQNFGANYEFSRDVAGLVEVCFDSAAPFTSADFTLYQLGEGSDSAHRTERAKVSLGLADLIRDMKIRMRSTDDSLLSITLVSAPEEKKVIGVLPFRLTGHSLDQGEYELVIRLRSGDDARTVKRRISLDWHDMPISLEDPRDALAPLAHITDEDEYNELASGSIESIREKVKAFWKKRDPSPGTAYNEMMAEFYRRADYSYFNFARNGRTLDGAITDRGKIYILFGAPTYIDRAFLLGEQPYEVWTYQNNVKRRFRFAIESSDYKLIEVNTL